ncbi:MAG: polysaccharide deacetylase family protein [Flavobacteriales bacterium]|nr:polysaccharide deacetylase family protein [Flavobacteriales bacterium]
MLVHSEHPTARLRYVVEHVFTRMLGWPVEWVLSEAEFQAADGPKLVHAVEPMVDAFHVPDSGWLRLMGVPTGPVHCQGEGRGFKTFQVGDDQDVFASIFHLLALTDELGSRDRDAHGRVPAASLAIVEHHVEHLPIVDHWVLDLARRMRARFPELPEPKRCFRHVLTVDVDNGLKYIGRPFHRAIGASVKDLIMNGPGAVAQRWAVRSGSRSDPYMILPERLAGARSHVDRTIAFFLMRGQGRFDHAAGHTHPAFRSLVQDVSKYAEVGLHPSYHASERIGRCEKERTDLEVLCGSRVLVNRQHFLRWDLPSTLRSLADQGFTEDHTLGFTDRVGFRAGTCTPFPWFDLDRNEATDLMLWPFAAMDSAVHEQMGVPREQAAARFQEIADAVKSVDGTFVSVWHDRYLSGHGEFSAWPEVMEKVVQQAGR